MATAAATETVPPDRGLALRYYPVTSADGTRLRAWTNDAEGPTVLLCNGLGTNPYGWPALLDPDCGVHVVSWNHRGTGGSERPEDPERVGMAEFVEDALAVMDDAGIDRCVVMGWSIGVNTAFELAVTHPDRVTGLFAAGGVPGDTFSSVLAPLCVPRPVRRPFSIGLARLMKLAGWPLTQIATHLPIGPHTLELLTHSGFMLPMRDMDLTALAVREFLRTPIDWYMHLALHSALHKRVSLRTIRVPTTFVAGRWDILASAEDMREAAESIPGAIYHELPSSHFICMERPDEVHEALLELLDRVPEAHAG